MGAMSTFSRALAVVSTAVVIVVASSTAALADAPTTWENPPHTSTLQMLGLLVGAPAGLFVLIALFALVVSRRNYVPPAPSTEVERAPGSAAAHH